MIKVLLAATVLAASTNILPNGHGEAVWGITVAQLQQLMPVHKATPGGEFAYADHAETDPDVYVRKEADGTRYEYYFFKNSLYKIFIVYSKKRTSPKFYREQVQQAVAKYGEPKGHYQEIVFGIPVVHTFWEDKRNTLDIRSGAGFVYHVIQVRRVVKQKALASQRKNSI